MVIDLNGTGRWDADSIVERYCQYCRELHIEPRILRPREHVEGSRRWVYPVMFEVIDGIANGDSACIRLGVDFIHEDGSFPFGRILKANTARALRRAELTPTQEQRIRKRVVDMLLRAYVPREFREYAKLLKKIGLDSARSRLEEANQSNPYVRKYYLYLIDP